MKKKKYKKVPLKKVQYKQFGGNVFGIPGFEDMLGNLTQTNVQNSLQGNNYFSDIANQFSTDMSGFGVDPNSAGSGLGLGMAGLMQLNEDSKNSALSASNDLIGQMFKTNSHMQTPRYAQDGGAVDPVMLGAIESSLNPQAKSETGAAGFGQITGIALTEFNNNTGKNYTKKDMYDPVKNIEVMKTTLNDIIPKQLKSKGLDLNLENVLSAYRQGAKGLKNNGLTELDKERADIYRSAEYQNYNNKLDIIRNGNQESLQIPAEFGKNPFMMGPQEMKDGGIPINPNGLYEENGPVIIPSNNITMKGINQNVLGIGDNGMTQLMRPNQNYQFNGANNVLEIPMAKDGMYVNGVDQHGFGDFVKGAWNGVKNVGKGIKDATLFGLDNASNLVLGNDFIKNDAYSFDFMGGLSGKTGNIANKIGGVAAPLVGNMLLPGFGGALASGARGVTSSIGAGQPQMQQPQSYPGYAGGMFQMPQQAQQQSNPFGNMMDIFGMAKQFGLFQGGGRVPQFSYKEGGHIGKGTMIGTFPDGTPIQAEKIKGLDEQIIFPDGRIADVHASDSHKKMNGNGDDDMVTDILPEGAYITSAYGGIKIKKKDADEIVTGIKQYGYEEGKKGKEPELFTVGDIFKKNEKKLEPATLSKRIQDMYKIIDKTDIFGEATNEANLQARLPLLQSVIGLSDIEKQKKEEAKAKRQMTKAESELIEEGMMFQKGGRVRKSQMKDYQAGGLLSTAATLLPSVLNIFGVGQNNENVDPRFQETYGNLNNLYNTEPLRYLANQNLINQYGDTSKDLINNSYKGFNQANALGTGLQAAGTLLQNPDVKFTETDLSQFDARNRQLRRDASNNRREIRDNTFSQIPLAELARSGNLNSINSVYNTGLSNVNKGISDANRQLSSDQGRVFEQRFNTSVANDRGRDAAFNQGTANRNNQLSALTDTVAQGVRTSGQSGLSKAQSMQGLESNLLQSLLGNNAQTLNNQIGLLGAQGALLNNPTPQPQVSGSGNLLNQLLNGYNNSTFGANLTAPDIGSNIFNQSGVSALQGMGADTGFSLNIPSFGFGGK